MALKKWQTVSSQLVFDNPWCKVRQDRVQLPSGLVVEVYFVSVRPDIALVLPITEDADIVFVRQYRHGVGEILLELPAGAFDPRQEDSYIAAKRELEEETGYVATHLTKIATLYDNPVKDTNKIHLFVAEVSPTGEQKLDVTEAIEVVLIPRQEVRAKIDAGDLCVSGTIAALFLGLNL